MKGFKVEIDNNSGFCAGVIRAIEKAEELLVPSQDAISTKKIFSLGAIVHNESELSRLENLGLVTIDKEDLEYISMLPKDGAQDDMQKEKLLLIRAHGEPPQTYELAQNLGFDVVDCTCPVVLKLQQDIKKAYLRQVKEGKGQIIIFGKIGHAEVLGLIGQTEGKAIIIEDCNSLEEKIQDQSILADEPTVIFSQTTKSPIEYDKICKRLSSYLLNKFTVHNSICKQVATRHKKLSTFAFRHDIIIFVSGKASSNGKILCELCKRINIRTYHISSIDEIKLEWFRKDDRIGVCGATSTPKWLLENIASHINKLLSE